MTNEERDRAIDFVIESQAKQESRLDRLMESHEKAEHRLEKTEHRLDRYERILKLMIRAGRRERRLRRDQNDDFDRRYRALLDSQAHTDSRLDALIDIVRRKQNGA